MMSYFSCLIFRAISCGGRGEGEGGGFPAGLNHFVRGQKLGVGGSPIPATITQPMIVHYAASSHTPLFPFLFFFHSFYPRDFLNTAAAED
jgi:hypothetical protein